MSAFTLIATPLRCLLDFSFGGLPEHGTTMNPLLLPVFDIETVRQTINTSSHEVITSGENLVEAAPVSAAFAVSVVFAVLVSVAFLMAAAERKRGDWGNFRCK